MRQTAGKNQTEWGRAEGEFQDNIGHQEEGVLEMADEETATTEVCTALMLGLEAALKKIQKKKDQHTVKWVGNYRE